MRIYNLHYIIYTGITSMKHIILVLRNNTVLLSHTIHSEYGASTYEVVNHIQVSEEYVQYYTYK